MDKDFQVLVEFANEIFAPWGKEVTGFVDTYYDLPTPDGTWKAFIVRDEEACYTSKGEGSWMRMFIQNSENEET